MIKNRIVISCFFLLSFLSCSNDDTLSISNDAEKFLNEVLGIMEANSVNKDNIDWTEFRNKVFEKAEGAQNISQTYTGIKEALGLLNDNHSFFIKPDGNTFSGYTLSCNAASTPALSLPDNIGYVKVNWFNGSGNSVEAIAFAQNIQDQISGADHSEVLGWIVDLRGNSGGNMWPMLAGIGPILGEGTAGYFVYSENNQPAWGYSNGSSISGGNTVTQLSNPYELIKPNPKVAVLLDQAVASSGESIAIGFIGRANTKSFGSSTCGQTTANNSFNLSNSSTLVLAVAYVADRNLNIYGIPLIPDEDAVNNEDAVQLAQEWIEN